MKGDEADGAGRVTVIGGVLARKDELQADVNRRRRLQIIDAQPRITQYQHSSFRFFDWG